MNVRLMGWWVLVICSVVPSLLAGNIDPAEKYAWASQVGWVNHAPSDGGGVTVADAGANSYLSGYAWAENIGWINFDSTHSQVTVNIVNGQFSGEAWGENIGWMAFRDTSPAYGVRTTVFVPIFSGTLFMFSSGSAPPPAGFVVVPAGTFTMGHSGISADETPVHSVTLSSFYLSKYETTYQLWYDVKSWADANGYTFAYAGREGHDGTDGAAPTGASSEPVTMVSWRDAIVWCNARSEQAGLTPAYTYSSATIKDSGNATACDNAVFNSLATGYRLPTEAQWEYAARYQDGVTFTPGDYLSGATAAYTDATASQAVAWYSVNSGSATHDVGGKTANQLGVFDTSGNVWEWCWDWYGTYGSGPDTNPTGPGSGSYRVLRGGSWLVTAHGCRVALRGIPPADADSHIGFRVVLPPGP